MRALTRIGRLGAQAILPGVVLLGAWAMMQALITAGDSSGSAPRTEPAEAVYAVRAETVGLSENRATFRAFGEVLAVGETELRVGSPGEVIALSPNLAIGKMVEAGEPLVTIDPFVYEGALREVRAQLNEATARRDEIEARIALEENAVLAAADQLDIAERDLDRALTLVQSGNITDKALDDRRLLVSQRQQTLDQRAFTLEAERARLAQQDAAVERLDWLVERAERALSDTVLEAPTRSIVREENVGIGRILAANDVAVSLISADALDVAFVISDQRYGRLLSEGPVAGRPVSIIWRIGDSPVRLSATITRTAADISSATGGVRLFARLAMPTDGTPVPRPGAFVEVEVEGPAHRDTMRLPATALYGDAVFVINTDDRMERRAVRVAARDGDDVILGGQLVDGDNVVTTRFAEAGEGIRVRAVDGAVPAPPALAANDEESAAVASALEPAAADTPAGPPSPAARRTRRGPPAKGARGQAQQP